jgi:hypothetical protein
MFVFVFSFGCSSVMLACLLLVGLFCACKEDQRCFVFLLCDQRKIIRACLYFYGMEETLLPHVAVLGGRRLVSIFFGGGC